MATGWVKVTHEGANVTGKLLTIGAFARRSRLSPKALRIYEQHEVLVPASVDPTNGYRRYAESQLGDARMVRLLRRLDIPLSEVAAIVVAPRAQRAELLDRYWQDAESRFIRQRAVAQHLVNSLSGGKDHYPMFEITIRDVAEQTILTEQAHVRANALPDWISAALGREHATLATIGGAAGPSLVIYHAEVTEDSDGPVEAATPVDPGRTHELEAPFRVEPAHREAFVSITKAQVRYPDILSAYDAVESWIAESGARISGSPREIYFADWDAAGEDDFVADIAYPIATES
jgi:DNA-binding transcriptional MerR regulator